LLARFYHYTNPDGLLDLTPWQFQAVLDDLEQAVKSPPSPF
jgi:hypothetical protein